MKKKKNDLKKLALMGLTGGLLFSAQGLTASENLEGQEAFFADNSTKYGNYLAGCGGMGNGNGNGKRQSSFGFFGSKCSSTKSVQNSGNTNAYQPSYGGSCHSTAHPQGGSCQSVTQPKGGSCHSHGGSCHSYQPQSSNHPSNNNNPYAQGRQGSCGGQNHQNYYTDNMKQENILDSEAERLDAERANPPTGNGHIAINETHVSGNVATKQAPLSEQELMNQLSAQGKATFQSLTAEGKALALKLANEYEDKNLAVKAAAAKMAEKRNGAINNAPAH
ncbi:MAG: hypothetical protein ACXVAJ_00050 [Parachlamydiaceae bacterium]